MVHRWLLKTAYTILLSNETLDQSISCLFDILLASEWDLPPHFRTFSVFGPNIFEAEKNSIEDMVHLWFLKTAYTIPLSKESVDLSISYLCKILLASEWALLPSFSCIFMFRTKHFSCREKIYLRYGPYMASKNCLYHSPFNWNP